MLMDVKEQATTLLHRTRWFTTCVRLSALVALVILLNIAVSWGIDIIELQIFPANLKVLEWAVLIGAITYIVLMATPFVPGIELGLALMLLLGPKGVFLIYVCTLVALSLSFMFGRFMPVHWLASILRWLHLYRGESLLRAFAATPPDDRLNFLARNTSTRAMPAILNRRYWVLAALLNLPGNAVVGGAGGIALLAGMSQLYSFGPYLLLITVAVLPGPIIVLLSKFIS